MKHKKQKHNSTTVEKNILGKPKQKKRKREKLSPYISRELLERARAFHPQKSLGQNFMVDEWILDEIVELANLDPENDVVIEIGPGLGFLTEKLLPKVKHLFAIDIDASISKSMKILEANHSNFTFLRQDFLRTDLADLEKMFFDLYPNFQQNNSDKTENKNTLGNSKIKFKIIANIPYQISTLILLHLFGEIGKPSPQTTFIDDVFILVQKEFAERICAKPGIKAYGSLTLFMQYSSEAEYLFEVEPQSFYPEPKVKSAYIKITPRSKPVVELEKPGRLRRFIHAVFTQRRKKLSNSLKAAAYNPELIESLNLGNLRGETLSIFEMTELVEKLDPIK